MLPIALPNKLAGRAGTQTWSRRISTRWSPLVWDATHTLDSVATDRLLDAARWSPPAGNSRS